MSIVYATIVPVHILIAPATSLRCLRDDHEPHEGLLVITHTLMGDLSLAPVWPPLVAQPATCRFGRSLEVVPIL